MQWGIINYLTGSGAPCGRLLNTLNPMLFFFSSPRFPERLLRAAWVSTLLIDHYRWSHWVIRGPSISHYCWWHAFVRPFHLNCVFKIDSEVESQSRATYTCACVGEGKRVFTKTATRMKIKCAWGCGLEKSSMDCNPPHVSESVCHLT